jgi:ATP phosphoribosyltransferase regulatory subunit
MSIADRWLLPDGIEELLPAQAARAEQLRSQLLKLYRRWGYALVIPPLVEFTDSLLVSGTHDLDLQTCKVTDQLSGRLMGVRADITPQTARIDAHGLMLVKALPVSATPAAPCTLALKLHSPHAHPSRLAVSFTAATV